MNKASSIDELLFKSKNDNIDSSIDKKEIKEIKEMFDLFIERIDQIEGKLDKLMSIFEKDIKTNCAKMSGHIDFVENVYTTIKSPLTYMVNSVNYLAGQTQPLELTDVSSSNALPSESENSDFEESEEENREMSF